MKIPKISLLVVIKGPVASAGSIPLLSKIMGINVPTNEAIIITTIKEIPTDALNLQLNPKM